MATCLRCGYDLRATPLDSPCPECGLAAHRSIIEHEHPKDSEPRWVQTIAVASVMLLASYLVAALVATLYIAGTLDDPFRVNYSVLSLWVLFAAGILHLIANTLLAAEERYRAFSWPIFLRSCVLYMFLPLVPLVGVMLQILFKTTGYFPWNSNPYLISSTICRVVLVCPIVTFLRLKGLAFRLSRPRLAEHIGIVAVGDAVSLVYVGLCQLLRWDSYSHILLGYVAGFFFALLPLALVMLFSLWSLFVLFEVSGNFVESARQARINWITDDAARR